ncbi:Viral enhancin protein [Candidatus Regiella insecticola 5.15]|uniref:Viral enhancin protein n=1 Tax=Candidatus Regiella insecticola 5.15 TaxID=1005043 RepID=G2H085_9ENTR|nr:putative mucin/carbohydrate-binding domain-containing protein [Candidatus Regiella insecticola]EGY28612.1 Viral enhancin protein [Candidatus Regiella insecticola 5.15]
MDRTNSINTVKELGNRISDVGLTTSTEQKQAIPQSVLDEELATQLIHTAIAAQLISGLQPNKLADKECEVTFRYLTPRYHDVVQQIKKPIFHTGLTTFTALQREITQSVLDEIAEKTGLEFRQVEGDEPADLVFGNFHAPTNSLNGFADVTADPYKRSEIWMNTALEAHRDPEWFKRNLVHEMGHALGLSHSVNLEDPGTIMSYSWRPMGLQVADFLALWSLHGRDSNPQSEERIRAGEQARAQMWARIQEGITPGDYWKNYWIDLSLRAGDTDIAFVAIDKIHSMLCVDVPDGATGADGYFRDKTYAEIRIRNHTGKVIFEKKIKGTGRVPSREEIPFTEGYQLEIYHAEAETGLLSTPDIQGGSVPNAKTNHFVMTKTGLKRLIPAHQMTLLDRNNYAFASLSVDAVARQLEIDISKPLADEHAQDSVYASIKVINKKGRVFFKKEIKGSDTGMLRSRILFSEGDKLEVYHAQAEERLKMLSAGVKADFTVDAKTTTFIMTSKGLEKCLFSPQPTQGDTTDKMVQAMSGFTPPSLDAVSCQQNNRLTPSEFFSALVSAGSYSGFW